MPGASPELWVKGKRPERLVVNILSQEDFENPTIEQQIKQLDITDAMRVRVKKGPEGNLKAMMQAVEETMVGFALVNITMLDKLTPDGYKITRDGLNLRATTEKGISHIFDRTNEGISVHNMSPKHAILGAASLRQIDPSCLSTSTKGPYMKLRVKPNTGTVLVLLTNGSHRIGMMTKLVIAPLKETKVKMEESIAKVAVGSPEHARFAKEIARLDASIKENSYWLMKFHDLDVIHANGNATDILSILSSNMQPNVVVEGEPNKIWMIAAGVKEDVGLSNKEFLLKLAKTTAYFVEPAKSGNRLRMVTRNPSLMRTFSALWPLVHFNPPTVLPVRVDLLNTIAGLTDTIFNAAIQSSILQLYLFASPALGDTLTEEAYSLLPDVEKPSYLTGIVDKFTIMFAAALSPSAPGIKLMEALDAAFCKCLKDGFTSLCGAAMSSKDHTKWEEYLDSYISTVCASVQSNQLDDPISVTIAKCLFYILKTPILSSFPPNRIIVLDTPFPVFTYNVFVCLRDIMAGRQNQSTGTNVKRAWKFLWTALAGMIEFTAVKELKAGPSTLSTMIATINDNLDTTELGTGTALATCVLSNLGALKYGVAYILKHLKTYKDAIQPLEAKDKVKMWQCLAAFHNTTLDDVTHFDTAVTGVLKANTSKNKKQPVLVLEDVLATWENSLSPYYQVQLEAVVSMLNLSRAKWYNIGGRELKKDVNVIHNALIHSILLERLAKNGQFNDLRLGILCVAHGLEEDDPAPDVYQYQWDRISREATGSDDDEIVANPQDDYKDFLGFDKSVRAIMNGKGVIKFTDPETDTSMFDEDVVASFHNFRAAVFLSHAKKALLKDNPNTIHVDLDLKWAKNELDGTRACTFPCVTRTVVDDYFDSIASSLKDEDDDDEDKSSNPNSDSDSNADDEMDVDGKEEYSDRERDEDDMDHNEVFAIHRTFSILGAEAEESAEAMVVDEEAGAESNAEADRYGEVDGIKDDDDEDNGSGEGERPDPNDGEDGASDGEVEGNFESPTGDILDDVAHPKASADPNVEWEDPGGTDGAVEGPGAAKESRDPDAHGAMHDNVQGGEVDRTDDAVTGGTDAVPAGTAYDDVEAEETVGRDSAIETLQAVKEAPDGCTHGPADINVELEKVNEGDDDVKGGGDTGADHLIDGEASDGIDHDFDEHANSNINGAPHEDVERDFDSAVDGAPEEGMSKGEVKATLDANRVQAVPAAGENTIPEPGPSHLQDLWNIPDDNIELVEHAHVADDRPEDKMHISEDGGSDDEDGGSNDEDGGSDDEDGSSDGEDSGSDGEDSGSDGEDGGSDEDASADNDDENGLPTSYLKDGNTQDVADQIQATKSVAEALLDGLRGTYVKLYGRLLYGTRTLLKLLHASRDLAWLERMGPELTRAHMLKSEIYCVLYHVAVVDDTDWRENEWEIKGRARALFKKWNTEHTFDRGKLKHPLRPVSHSQLVLTQEEEDMEDDEDDTDSDGYGILSQWWTDTLSDQ